MNNIKIEDKPYNPIIDVYYENEEQFKNNEEPYEVRLRVPMGESYTSISLTEVLPSIKGVKAEYSDGRPVARLELYASVNMKVLDNCILK